MAKEKKIEELNHEEFTKALAEIATIVASVGVAITLSKPFINKVREKERNATIDDYEAYLSAGFRKTKKELNDMSVKKSANVIYMLNHELNRWLYAIQLFNKYKELKRAKPTVSTPLKRRSD